jgi:hopanoid biosynthesis associated RND transporter like protein HpnN
MAQSQEDTTVATVVAFVVCALIFVYGYQETGRPIKATACLVVGVAYTMGFTTLAIGHLNVLTITFVPILIGLAIDFGVHLISRYEEEMRHGRTREEAIHKAMVQTGRGIFTGCLTTAGAFLAIGFTEFRGIQEMGLICGAGLLLCLVPMMTLLPVLLLRGRQNVIDHARAADTSSRAQIERIWLSRPWLTLAVVVAASTLAVLQIKNVRFDYNLLHMQSDGLPAVEYEKKLINSAEKSVLFAALVATNVEQALELESRAKALPSVAMADSIAPFLSGDQSRKLALVGEIKQVVAPLKFLEPDAAPANIQELSQVLWSLSGYLGLALEELEKAKAEAEPPGRNDANPSGAAASAAAENLALAARLRSLRNAILDLRRELFKADAAQVAAKMGAYQHAFFDDVRATFETIRNQDNRDRLRVEDLPAALRNRFVGKSGNFMVMVYPKKDVWERESQAEFIGQLRTVDPNVTGTPVQLYEYTSLLVNSYLEAAGYALIAIMVMVLIYFRSLVCLLLALMPVALGALWMVGMMGMRDIMFNPANIMTLPLVIGIGVTNGIHVLTRFSEEQHPSIFDRSTGKAVLVSGLTTIAGFGSLMLAKHQGIASLGFVMSVGVTTCMILGLVALPALLSILLRLGWKIRQ